jgi:hypothetical protein
MFKLQQAQRGVNTMFRKGQNSALKISKGIGKATDVLHKGAVVVERVGQATGIPQLEGAGKLVATTTHLLGNALDKGNRRLGRAIEKSENFRHQVNNKIDNVHGKIDNTLQRVKNIKNIAQTDGQQVINDGKRIFGV